MQQLNINLEITFVQFACSACLRMADTITFHTGESTTAVVYPTDDGGHAVHACVWPTRSLFIHVHGAKQFPEPEMMVTDATNGRIDISPRDEGHDEGQVVTEETREGAALVINEAPRSIDDPPACATLTLRPSQLVREHTPRASSRVAQVFSIARSSR
jgi:hypothetical protein